MPAPLRPSAASCLSSQMDSPKESPLVAAIRDGLEKMIEADQRAIPVVETLGKELPL